MDLDDTEIWKLRDIIVSNVSIVELAKEYGLKLESRSAGQFSHRAFCPFHKGKNGKTERTPSFFISEATKSFCCFSCNYSGSIIDFIRLMDGTPPSVVLIKLAKRVGLIDKDGKWDELKINSFGGPTAQYEPVKTIEPFLFEISSSIRNFIKLNVNDERELRWIEKVAEKVDEFLSSIGHEDWEYAQDLCEKVKKNIKNRMKKNENSDIG